MKNPYLIVLTGYPCSGKTRLANQIARKKGFVRVNHDDQRKTMFNRTFFEIDMEEERHMRVCVRDHVTRSLTEGYHVIFDSCAPSNEERETALDVNSVPREVIRYLVWLDVKEEQLLARAREKYGNEEDARRTLDYFTRKWENPRNYEGVNLLGFNNNSDVDYHSIIQKLGLVFNTSF